MSLERAQIIDSLSYSQSWKPLVLLAFHAITGADNAGSFSGKGKVSSWKEFQEADDSILSALDNLGREEQPDEAIKDAIERFACQLYLPKKEANRV